MYQRNIKIVLISEDALLEEQVRAIPTQSFSTHEIERYEKFDADALSDADIVIVNVSLPCSLEELRAACKEGCRIILCVPPEVEAKMEEKDYFLVDDIWLTPVQPPRIQLRLRNLLSEFKKDDEARQHLLWLDTLIDSMPDLVWFKDMGGIHRKVNSKFCEFVKKDRNVVVGSTHSKIWDTPEDDESCRESEEKAIRAGTTILTDEVVKVGNEKHLFKTYKTPLKGRNGEILGTVGFGHDLTNLLNLDMELNFFVESMPLPLAICDSQGAITQINSRFSDFFGVQKSDIMGKSLVEWQDETLQITTSPVDGENYLRFLAPDGRFRYVSVSRKGILDIFGKKMGAVSIYRDITSDKELEIRIWRAANTDSLTGLANRNAFEHYIEKLSPGSVVHLCYIDLDEFKSVNDHYGHKAGDEALRIVAKSIRNVFAQDFPARLGGDEFIVCIQRDVPLSEIERLVERFLSRIQEKFGSSAQLSRMSASVGIRYAGLVDDTLEKLIRQADLAMYQAKARGKGCYCLWDETLKEDD